MLEGSVFNRRFVLLFRFDPHDVVPKEGFRVDVTKGAAAQVRDLDPASLAVFDPYDEVEVAFELVTDEDVTRSDVNRFDDCTKDRPMITHVHHAPTRARSGWWQTL